MSQLEGFVYEIGAVLVHRACLADPATPEACRLFVVERLAQNCPGGVQRHYRCRAVSADGHFNAQPFDLLQEELAPYSEYAAIADARRTARAAAEDERWQRRLAAGGGIAWEARVEGDDPSDGGLGH